MVHKENLFYSCFIVCYIILIIFCTVAFLCLECRVRNVSFSVHVMFIFKGFFVYFRFLGVFKFMLMAVLHLAPFSRVSVVSISDSRKSN